MGEGHCEAIFGKKLYDNGEKEKGLALINKAAKSGNALAQKVLSNIKKSQ